jgi:hypothetical protein
VPLDPSDTPKAFSNNVAELIKSGRPKAKAVAIAYKTRRKGRKKPK